MQIINHIVKKIDFREIHAMRAKAWNSAWNHAGTHQSLHKSL